MGKLGVSSGLEFAILVAREADAEQAANLKRVDDSASGPKQSTAGTCCLLAQAVDHQSINWVEGGPTVD